VRGLDVLTTSERTADAHRGPLWERVGGELLTACRLGGRVWMALMELDETRETPAAVRLFLGGEDLPLPMRSHRLTPPPGGPADVWARHLVMALSPRVDPGGRSIRAELRSGRRKVSLLPEELADRVTDIGSFMREHLAALAPESREELLAFISAASDWEPPGMAGLELSRDLLRVREMLREPFPTVYQGQDVPRGLHVDRIMSVDDRMFWIEGWMREVGGSVERRAAVAPEGLRAELMPGRFEVLRPDVLESFGEQGADPFERCGFIQCFELHAPSRLQGEWLCEMQTASGRQLEAVAPDVIRDETGVRNRLLREMHREHDDLDTLARGHVAPALSRIQKRTAANVQILQSIEYGKAPRRPDVSIVVPLYRRTDLLEHQLAQFAHDPEMARVDLVYVLDFPDAADTLRREGESLYQLYRVPFRVLTLDRTVGCSIAGNLGVSRARGRLLVLMHSDVLPAQAGWLSAMTAFHERTSGIGALGPKLLHEDDSVQSAGTRYARALCADGWEVEDRFRGLHRRFPAVAESCPVPAVSGACLMVRREEFVRAGGLDGAYVGHGFEDSDFCLRLARNGAENWYQADVEMYHLQGRSYTDASRSLTEPYNAWLHGALWGRAIEALSGRDDPSLARAPRRPRDQKGGIHGQ
jgi:GT2 family glycosyltransferase